MDRFEATLPHSDTHDRKYRRFSLKYPVLVTFPFGDSYREINAVSRNVSIGGLLIEAANVIPRQAPVSFTIKVEGGRMTKPVHLSGEGHVVRVESAGTEAGFAIAVECNQPMRHLEEVVLVRQHSQTRH